MENNNTNYTFTHNPGSNRIVAESKESVVSYTWCDGYIFLPGGNHFVGMLNINEDYDETSTADTYRMYMTLSLPTMPSYARIAKAELVFFQDHGYGVSENTRLALHEVTGEIVNGTCTPAMEALPVAIAAARASSSKNDGISYTLDITKLINKLRGQGKTETSLLLKTVTETGRRSDFVCIFGMNEEDAPTLRLTYEAGLGVVDGSRALTHAIGAVGESTVDLATGRLSLAFGLHESYGLRAPFALKTYYNSALAGCAYTAGGADQIHTANFSGVPVGKGFRMNVMQSMVTYGDGYLFTTEEGEELYFAPKDLTAESPTKFVATDGSDALYNATTRLLTMGEDTLSFDTAGRCFRHADSHGNYTLVSYSDGQISGLNDCADYFILFGYYDDEGHLTCTSSPTNTVLYAYENDLLTEIEYTAEKIVRFTWQDGLPTAITLCKADGTQLSRLVYTYADGRVASVTEYGADNTEGVSQAIAYDDPAGKTVVTATIPTDTAAGETSAHVLTTTYALDYAGNVIGTSVHSSREGDLGTGDTVSASHTENLLRSARPGVLGCWQVSNGENARMDTKETNAKFGTHCFSLHSEDETASHYASLYELTDIEKGDYTFSAYVRVHTPITGGEEAGVFLRVYDYSGSVLAESEHLTAVSDYVRLSVPFTMTTIDRTTVEIRLNGMGGVYADGVQLEKCGSASPLNLLGRIGHAMDEGNFTLSDGVIYGTETYGFNVLQMAGSITDRRYAYYDAPVKTPASTRETFTLSGFAQANSLPLAGCNATFGLKAVIRYKDGTTEEHLVSFSSETEAKQFVSLTFAKKEYKPVSGLKVYCEYSYNNGTAFFFAPCLVRDSIETGLSAEDFTYITDAVYDEEEEETESGDTAPVFEELTDAYGNPLTETTFTDGEFGTLYRSFGYSENGDFLTAETDARGGVTAYTKADRIAKPASVIDRCGNKTLYTYSEQNELIQVTSKDASDNLLGQVSYAYDSFGNMKAITRGDGQKYVLGYDNFHNLSSIGIDGKAQSLAAYDYTTGGRLRSVTYANGDKMSATYDAKGQLTQEKWQNANGVEIARYKYSYDKNGNVTRSLDIFAKKEYTYIYEDGRLARAHIFAVTLDTNEYVVGRTAENTILYQYDGEGNLTKKTVSFADGAEQVIHYENTETGVVVKYGVPHPVNIITTVERTLTAHSKTDSFGRKIFEELQYGAGAVSRSFDYHPGAVSLVHGENAKLKSAPITNLVSEITMFDGSTLSYEYDAEERITSVVYRYKLEEGYPWITKTTTYTYDALGQLVEEKVDGVTVTAMTYDGYGNILSKNGKSYTYGDSVWKDLLTSYDGQSISYDAQGNPTSYLGHTLTWEKGRQLKSFDGNTYTYNANGIRTSKTVNGIKHTYTLDGTKILREEWTENGTAHTLIPLYDNEDSVCGITYDDRAYFFRKNLQGDVIAVVDITSGIAAHYVYDAWGNVSVLNHFETPIGDITEYPDEIGNINPFRYRGKSDRSHVVL